MNKQNGNVVFIILLAVAVFAALAYAFTQGSRGNLTMMTSEAAKANLTKSQDCAYALKLATKRLALRGCTSISSSTDMASITNPSCAVYHISGGGLAPCQSSASAEPCTTSSLGQVCPDGSVYAGISPDGNKRMYAMPSDGGTFTWNNGSTNWVDTIGSCWDTPSVCVRGKANTETLIGLSGAGAPYAAAQFCGSLIAMGHDDWYLPGRSELAIIYNNRNNGAFANTWGTTYVNSTYWSSSEDSSYAAYYVNFADGSNETGHKTFANSIRCVRTD